MMTGPTTLIVPVAQSVPVPVTSRKNTNMSEHYGVDWTCETCGRKMTPHGDCVRCAKKEKARQIAEGEIKRGKDIKVGDQFTTHWSFKIDPITCHTIEPTKAGKVVINRGMGWQSGECSIWGEQWVDMIKPSQT